MPENSGMMFTKKKLLRILAAALLLLVLLGWSAQAWVASADARRRVTQALTDWVGVPVALEKIELQFWPLPALRVQALSLQTQPPLSMEQLRLRPAIGALLFGRLRLAALQVSGVVLNERAIDKLIALQKKKQKAQDEAPPQNASEELNLPERVDLDQINWINAKGKPTVLQGHLQFSDLGELDAADLTLLSGQFEGARVQTSRDGTRWSIEVDVAGGTVKGWLLGQRPSGVGSPLEVTGELQTRQLEVGRLTTPPTLSGLLEADTRMNARVAAWGELAEQLQTQSHFTVRQAVIHGLDLEKAVSTVGLSRGGQTRLDVLTGQLATRGQALHFTQLLASSGALSASGQVRVTPSTALSGQVQVVLGQATLGQTVGVPLELGGTLAEPQVSLTRSALLGAAIGTAVMPGVGTGAGASLGGKLGTKINKIFGK